MNFPRPRLVVQNGIMKIVDEDVEQKPLEQRVDHLTTTVEGMQKILDRFIALYESDKLQSLSQRDGEEKQKLNPLAPKDFEKERLKQEMFVMKLQIERQTSIYVRDKMQWEGERDKMERELERYKSLFKTNNPFTQTTTGTEPTNKQEEVYKCENCNDFMTRSKEYFKFHQAIDCDRTPRSRNLYCGICEKQFLQKTNFDRHMTAHKNEHPYNKPNKDTVLKQMQGVEASIARNKRRQAIREEYQIEFNKCVEPDEPVQWKRPKTAGRFIRLPLPPAITPYDTELAALNLKGMLTRIKQSQELIESLKPPAPAAAPQQSGKQQSKQNAFFAPIEAMPTTVDETAKALRDKLRVSEPSPVVTPAAPEPESPVTIPSNGPIDVNIRRNLRQRFISLLLRHPCKSSECSLVAFRKYVEHASACVDGPDCSWYICKRVHAKTEHLKVCEDKLECAYCQPYICFNEDKMQGMMKVLEKGCTVKQEGVHRMNESTTEAIMTMVARLAVNYGLVGDDETTDDKEKPDEDEDMSDGQQYVPSSSDEEEESSDGEDVDGEEKEPEDVKMLEDEITLEEEKESSDEWEFVESERGYEVD